MLDPFVAAIPKPHWCATISIPASVSRQSLSGSIKSDSFDKFGWTGVQFPTKKSRQRPQRHPNDRCKGFRSPISIRVSRNLFGKAYQALVLRVLGGKFRGELALPTWPDAVDHMALRKLKARQFCRGRFR